MGIPTYSLRPSSVGADPLDVSTPAANTAATLNYAAATGASHAISGIVWSYNAAPTGGNLKIEDGAGNTILSGDVTAGGPGVLMFSPPLRGTATTALIVTLAAGGGGVSGKLSAIAHWTDGASDTVAQVAPVVVSSSPSLDFSDSLNSQYFLLGW